MFGTVLDAGRSVRIFPFRIFLPTILDRVVALHRRALLLADAVVVEVAAGLKCEDDNDDASDDDFFHSLTFQFNQTLIDCSLMQSVINPGCYFNGLGNGGPVEDVYLYVMLNSKLLDEILFCSRIHYSFNNRVATILNKLGS